ncbi:MAG: hypothetical protein ACJ8AO_01475 [Gemmatimonadaceae bacterium]
MPTGPARSAAPGAHRPRYDFDPRIGSLTRFERVCRNLAVAVFVVNAVLALVSGHRAIWQVQRLNVRASARVLRPGTRLAAAIQSSGRTRAAVVLELVQGDRTELLAEKGLPGNHNPAMNFLPRRDSVVVLVTPAMLAGFAPGRVTVRATGHGSAQWLRVPPPEVRELAAEIPRP